MERLVTSSQPRAGRITKYLKMRFTMFYACPEKMTVMAKMATIRQIPLKFPEMHMLAKMENMANLWISCNFVKNAINVTVPWYQHS